MSQKKILCRNSSSNRASTLIDDSKHPSPRDTVERANLEDKLGVGNRNNISFNEPVHYHDSLIGTKKAGDRIATSASLKATGANLNEDPKEHLLISVGGPEHSLKRDTQDT